MIRTFYAILLVWCLAFSGCASQRQMRRVQVRLNQVIDEVNNHSEKLHYLLRVTNPTPGAEYFNHQQHAQ